ncbi:uncharacterized protein LOC143445755 isoform X2 [Clavelina lepadiformis]|uniref:uncharacterized protein LOC143445755 isoform X2 n=1 Tax=Clavelina lepadiformis TaxID=159417 RepID=UPI004041C057
MTITDVSATISTDPPYNPLATGFNNLIVTAQFPTPTSNTDACFWFYGGELDSGSGAQFYSGIFGGCVVSSPGTYDSITCTEQTIDGTNHTITTLTITQPLVARDINIEVRCIVATNTPGPINRTVQECSSSLPYDVIVNATSRIFNSPGKFACSNGGDLFYSNGTMLTSSDTTCLASAEWIGQDNLQCWTATNVTLASSSIDGNKLTVVEGNDLTLTCNYDDVIPAGDTSRFYIGRNSYTRTQGLPFILSPIQRSDNNKIVSCQAITPYTDLYPASARSSEYTLDVFYISSSVINKIETSQFVIEASESNYLLRSDRQLTMNCTPSDANPPATCSWQLCSDSRCQTLTSDGGCLITVDLNASSNVTCAAENIVGNVTSAEQTVNVVPAERQVQFNVTGSNVTNDGSINSTTYLGESIMISCSVSYENELNTTYLIKLPNNSMISQSSKLFSSLTRDDSGDYICSTNDQFGSFNAAIYLNVIYAPQEDDVTTSDDCNDQPVTTDGMMTIKSNGDEQTFEFQKNEVTSSDNGTYTLTVQSSNKYIFHHNVQIIFHIIVADEPPPTPGLSIGAIIGISCGVAIIFISVAAYAVFRWRRGTKMENESGSIYTNEHHNQIPLDQPAYIEVVGNDSTQMNSHNQSHYEVVGPAQDDNGYLVVNGNTSGDVTKETSNFQPETDNAGYVVLNGRHDAESNNQGNESSSSKRYENIDGAYDDVITAPHPHTEFHNGQPRNESKPYENIEHHDV